MACASYTADFDSVSLGGFYRGRSAFLILSGPSLTQLDLSAAQQARHRHDGREQRLGGTSPDAVDLR
jgi:hypothetical protein